MASRLLKKPPTQAIIAGGPLPTVKDQACSIIAPATTQGATRQPTTQTAHGPNIPGGTSNSNQDFGPGYKDQVRSAQPKVRRQTQQEKTDGELAYEEKAAVLCQNRGSPVD